MTRRAIWVFSMDLRVVSFREISVRIRGCFAKGDLPLSKARYLYLCSSFFFLFMKQIEPNLLICLLNTTYVDFARKGRRTVASTEGKMCSTIQIPIVFNGNAKALPGCPIHDSILHKYCLLSVISSLTSMKHFMQDMKLYNMN
jgi:hypothetical protein